MTAREPYPLPSFALSVWIVGDKLHLGVPPQEGHEKPHTLVLPIDKYIEKNGLKINVGLAALIDLLRERECFKRATIIGTPAEPVQYDLDEIIRKMTRYDGNGKAKISLEDLGL